MTSKDFDLSASKNHHLNNSPKFFNHEFYENNNYEKKDSIMNLMVILIKFQIFINLLIFARHRKRKHLK